MTLGKSLVPLEPQLLTVGRFGGNSLTAAVLDELLEEGPGPGTCVCALDAKAGIVTTT